MMAEMDHLDGMHMRSLVVDVLCLLIIHRVLSLPTHIVVFVAGVTVLLHRSIILKHGHPSSISSRAPA